MSSADSTRPRERLKLTTRIAVFITILFAILMIVVMLVISVITIGYLDRSARDEFSSVTTQINRTLETTFESSAASNNADILAILQSALQSQRAYDPNRHHAILVDSNGKSSFDESRSRTAVRPFLERAAAYLDTRPEQIRVDLHDSSGADAGDAIADPYSGQLIMTVEATSSSTTESVTIPLEYRLDGNIQVYRRTIFGTNTYYSVQPILLSGNLRTDQTSTDARTSRVYLITFYFAKSESDFIWILNTALLFASAVGIGVLLTFGTVFARTALQPLKDLSAVAGSINFEEYNDRIPRPQTEDEVTHLIDSLNRMLANLQQAYDYQKRFSSDVAHELRIPLTIIIGYLDLVRRYGSDDAGLLEEALSSIEAEAAHMKTLTDSLLLLARLENKKIQPVYDAIDITAWSERIVGESRLLYPDHHVTCDASVDDRLFTSDENLLTQVVRCLIENSVKYSQAGTEIRIAIVRFDHNVRLSVADSGRGIPADRIARLTHRFYRVDEDRSRETGGTGLGLAIADSIIKALHGTMHIASTLGVGTTVTVTVPDNTLPTA